MTICMGNSYCSWGVEFANVFHVLDRLDDVLDGTHRICRALKTHGAKYIQLIDPISGRRTHRGNGP